VEVLITTGLAPADRDCLVESFPEVRFRAAAAGSSSHDPGLAQVLFADRVTEDFIAAASALEWIQVRSAGVDHLPLDAIAARGIALTNGRGAHGIPVAETALAMMLAFSTGLADYVDARRERRWVRPVIVPKRFELEGQTLLVVGLGDLGSSLARKARAIGMTVIGCDLAPPDPMPPLSRFVAAPDLDAALGGVDHVALCLPLTARSRGLFGRDRIGRLKRGAYFYNMGRGALVDQDALVAALEAGDIAGAGLDATATEPIPPDDPVWRTPNVLLTQHSGGASPHNSRRVTDLFSENLHRFRNGYPLLNVVDAARGY
jgi:phosphoglycerate dehydrogenase-like enzyme